MNVLLVLLGLPLFAAAAVIGYNERSPINESRAWEILSSNCGESEVFKDCASLSCGEVTCEQQQPPAECTPDCVYQCFCATGFYRNREGRCVTLNMCARANRASRNRARIVK
ncbi:unnamed protein product [Ixodes persulcatus]